MINDVGRTPKPGLAGATPPKPAAPAAAAAAVDVRTGLVDWDKHEGGVGQALDGIGQALKDAAGPAPAPTQVPLPTLKQGASGPDVQALQELLAKYDPTVEVDGQYGPATEAAVRRFQELNGLKTDGLAGPETHGMLLARTHLDEARAIADGAWPADQAGAAARMAELQGHLQEAAYYRQALRPESQGARERLMKEIEELEGRTKPQPEAGPRVEEPEAGPLPGPGVAEALEAARKVVDVIGGEAEEAEEEGPSEAEIKAKLAFLEELSIEDVVEAAQAGKFKHAPPEVQEAALERLVGDHKTGDTVLSWVGLSEGNDAFAEAASKIAVDMLKADPDAATMRRVLKHVDDEFGSRVVKGLWEGLGAKRDDLDVEALEVLLAHNTDINGSGVDPDVIKKEILMRGLGA